MTAILYKICPREMWRRAVETGAFAGAPVDVRDGFIHFSTGVQVAETAAKHFSGQDNLMLVAVDAAALGDALRWEPSRGGDLFPHLYGGLAISAVVSAQNLPLGPDGAHVFPHGVLP